MHGVGGKCRHRLRRDLPATEENQPRVRDAGKIIREEKASRLVLCHTLTHTGHLARVRESLSPLFEFWTEPLEAAVLELLGAEVASAGCHCT